MSIRVHIVNSVEPIVWHGEAQLSICGKIIEEAVPANIVPDIFLCSVGGIASTFGNYMCTRCQVSDDPPNGWVYFCLTRADSQKLKQLRELAEAI